MQILDRNENTILKATLNSNSKLIFISNSIPNSNLNSSSNSNSKIVMHSTKKSYVHWRGIATYLYSQLMKLLLISHNMNYPRKDLIYLRQVYTFQSNQIKFKNMKSSLPLKRFIVRFLTTLNPRKPKVR